MTAKKKPLLRIEFTPEQKEQIRQALGTQVAGLEWAAEELEQRISPGGLLRASSLLGQAGIVGPEENVLGQAGIVGPEENVFGQVGIVGPEEIRI